MESNKKKQYSQQKIAEVLFSLLKQYPYGEITVTMLCQYSGVSHSSFYRNYVSKDDVIIKAVTSFVDEEFPDPLDQSRLFLDYRAATKVLRGREDIFLSIFQNDLNNLVFTAFRNVIEECIRANDFARKKQYYAEYIPIRMSYIVCAYIHAYCFYGRGMDNDAVEKRMDEFFEIFSSKDIEKFL